MPRSDNAGARYYSSSLGRFMTPDALGGHLEDPQTLNKYAYVENNPVTLTDPTGLDFNLTCKQNSSTCQNGKVGVTTTDANGNSSFAATVISNGANGGLVDQYGNAYSGTFDQTGVHITAADGTTISGAFINASAANTLQGSGIFSGFTGVFNDNCGGTCVASGSIFSTSADPAGQFKNLTDRMLRNPGMDSMDFFHPGSTQYREGNPSGPDPHVVFKNSTLESANPYEQFHYDGSYPYATVPGFFDHASSAISSLFHSITGPSELPAPTQIPGGGQP